MRGFLLGLLLLPVLAIAILSVRPGGLRRQLRFAARRLRLALILAGVYLLASTAGRLVADGSAIVEDGLIGLAAVLALLFVIVGQDPGQDPDRHPGTRAGASARQQSGGRADRRRG